MYSSFSLFFSVFRVGLGGRLGVMVGKLYTECVIVIIEVGGILFCVLKAIGGGEYCTS